MNRYQERLARVQEKLNARAFEVTVITDPVSVEYLVGVHVSHIGERLMALAIPKEGKATLFINKLFPIMERDVFDVVYHDDTDIPTKDLAVYLPSGTVGIDRFMMSQFLIELLDARDDISPKVGSFAVEECRMIKDAAEQDAMRKAAQICDRVFTAVPDMLREGMSEIALSKLIEQKFQELGDPSAGVEALVCFGAGSSEPHHTNTEKPLEQGDVVLIDAGQTTFGYTSDMTRTFFYGSVTAEQKKVYDVVCEANRLAREKVAPGVPLSEIDAAARDYIASQGYGEYFTHRTGHNIGIQMHEEPSVAANNPMPAQEGMCFSIEPGIYLPNHFGVRIEDIVLVTKDGCETLNKYPKELRVL